jgi:hypothetical protein
MASKFTKTKCEHAFQDLFSITQLEPGKPLAPPSALKMKILIKNKRMKPEVEKVEMELFLKGELKTDDDPKEDASAAVAPAVDAPAAAAGGDGAAPAAGGDAAAAHTGSTTNVHPWLSSMVNYAQPVHFNGFEAAASKLRIREQLRRVFFSNELFLQRKMLPTTCHRSPRAKVSNI